MPIRCPSTKVFTVQETNTVKKNLALIAMAVAALSISACERKESTEIEHSSTTVDASGTETTRKVDAEATRDENGTVKGDVDTKTTVDPEGLMNKTTTETHREVE